VELSPSDTTGFASLSESWMLDCNDSRHASKTAEKQSAPIERRGTSRTYCGVVESLATRRDVTVRHAQFESLLLVALVKLPSPDYSICNRLTRQQ
jgi:hypothetical protein